jgi:hypothetical protein
MIEGRNPLPVRRKTRIGQPSIPKAITPKVKAADVSSMSSALE